MIAVWWLFRSLRKYSDVEALKHDSAVLAEMQKTYQEGEDALAALKADEASVIAKLDAGDQEGAMELFEAVLRTHSKAESNS